jgi:serine phosphatase RsbU (regulator of sigma subunit)
MKSPLIRYFLLKDADARFCGIFSTKDMLIHLSDMLRRDVATVRSFQAKVVPERAELRSGSLEFAGFSRPAKDAGGDYYMFRTLSDGTVLSLIADVSGKGVGASYFTAACAACADSFDFDLGLGAYLSVLNRHLARRYGDTGCFLTCVALLADPETGQVRACDMGHSYLYLLRGSSYSAIRLPGCPPLGVDEDAVPKVARFALEKGDTVFAVTDGVAEQRGNDGEEYGVERAVSRLKSLKALGELRDVLCADIDAFRGFRQQHDDLTAIALRMH